MNDKRDQRQIEIACHLVAETETAVFSGIPADATLARLFRTHPEFGSSDRRHYRHVVFCYFRWLGWTRRIAPDSLEKRCAWSVMLDDYSDEAMLARWSRQCDLTSSEVSAWRAESLSQKSKRLGIESNCLLPDWVLNHFTDPEVCHRFITSCLQRLPAWVVVDSTLAASFAIMLTAQRMTFIQDARLPGAFAIDTPFQIEILQRAWGRAIQVQDIASQAVVAIAQATPGEHWWDACSGAGGKTLGLSRMVGSTGNITATDTRDGILDNLRRRAAAHNATHIETHLLDASQSIPDEVLFDGVLVDAPCSGLGTWPRNPDARWRTSPDFINQCAIQQSRILRQCARAVRPGGTLVYSVCTLTVNEGPELTRNFIREHSDFALVPFTHPFTGSPTPGELTLQPDEGPGDGMYIARMVRSA